MPIPTTLPARGAVAPTSGPGRPARALVATALVLAVCAALLPQAAGVVFLALAVAALAAASALALRAGWRAGDRPLGGDVVVRSAVQGELISEDALTEQLRLLNERYVEKVNEAIDHDRPELAQELSDAYADDALRLMAAAGRAPQA